MSASPRAKAAFKATSSTKVSAQASKARKEPKATEFFAESVEGDDLLGEDTRETLVMRYRLKARKLARSILRKWHSRLDLQEVDSIVDLSLCEAVARYNPKKGASFMTFLFYHLRGNLIRAVSYAASLNAVPFADTDQSNQNGEKTDLRTSIYKGANAMEIAEALCGQDRMLPDEMLFMKEMVNMSQLACSKLDSLEQEVIERIYLQEQQLMDIANTLGYSRCHISRVKRKALETLYNELSGTVEVDGAAKRPFFCDEEEAGPRRKADRRRVYRRRPRARASGKDRMAVSA